MKPAIVVNCGAGSTSKGLDAAEKAGRAGYDVLLVGGKAIDAVEAAIVLLEDDKRFNAGTGSKIRLDGSVQMDAGIMDSEGNCGAVACISNVKNPIRVARRVADTPHHLLVGEEATGFARKHGFDFYDPRTPDSMKLHDDVKRKLREGDLPRYAAKWKEYHMEATDTVGAVARDGSGGFAAAVSTGGTNWALSGRVGDTPLIGCGFFAGNEGAVCTTGIGEFIMRKVLAKWIYDRIEEGLCPREASKRGVALIEKYVPTGVVAVSKLDHCAECNMEMAYWASE